MYALFECSASSNPKKIRDKYHQLERQLAYLLEHQRRRQRRDDIKITEIVAVSGACTVLQWKHLKGTVPVNIDGGGRSELPLCSELAREGRLLCITLPDPYKATMGLTMNVRKCMSRICGWNWHYSVNKYFLLLKPRLFFFTITLDFIKSRFDTFASRMDAFSNTLDSIQSIVHSLVDKIGSTDTQGGDGVKTKERK
jgi:hypothetical protein